jgi:acyl-CoA reductase-like NAD-dependent aldehyde dehydrogenase
MTIEQTAGGAATGSEVTKLQMVIGGESVDAADGQTFEIVNPANGRVIATAPLGGKEDVDRQARPNAVEVRRAHQEAF